MKLVDELMKLSADAWPVLRKLLAAGLWGEAQKVVADVDQAFDGHADPAEVRRRLGVLAANLADNDAAADRERRRISEL